MTINYYNENAQIFFETTVNADMKGIYREFEKNLSKNVSILDLGCWSGRDSRYFLDQGYKVTSTDISDELIKKANEHLGINVLKLDMKKMDFQNEFDGIWACASILHIPRNEILKVLDNCYSALKKTGFYIQVLNTETER
ncbi:class I SAM-dependent methyltransferase [uncultured Ilyobacter sp.]|uniref:class I SAM-dependent methyltransferase n=1 Tax=uncultured Ilyobacter sp. TaxID=544433 RepID=UPI0029C65C9D|nr:class I SAM-dependent methyltransferase [uncultured Ilyobacter sp.]